MNPRVAQPATYHTHKRYTDTVGRPTKASGPQERTTEAEKVNRAMDGALWRDDQERKTFYIDCHQVSHLEETVSQLTLCRLTKQRKSPSSVPRWVSNSFSELAQISTNEKPLIWMSHTILPLPSSITSCHTWTSFTRALGKSLVLRLSKSWCHRPFRVTEEHGTSLATIQGEQSWTTAPARETQILPKISTC